MYSADYFEGLEQLLGADGMEIALVIFAVYMIIYVLTMITSILNYVFTSISLYTVGKRRGLKNYGLAWLPFGGSMGLLGCIADQYDRKANGKDKKLGRFLLIGYIVILAVVIVATVALCVGMIGMITADEMGAAASSGYIITTVVGAILFLLICMFAIVWSVFQYIALFKFYRSCTPKNAAWMLVLSILIGGLFTSISMLCVRKLDGGFEELQQATEPADEAEEPTEATEE